MKQLRLFVLISIPALVLTLLSTEVCLRIGGYAPYYLDGKAFVPSKSREMVYELRPGFHGLFAGSPVSINSQGFRGKELARSDDAPTFRLAVLGDSVAFGQSVPEGESLAEHLANRLHRGTGLRVEAVNLGVPGYDTCQEYWLFREKGISLNPKIAVLMYVDNDTDPPVFQVVGDAVVSPDVRTGIFGDFMAMLRKRSYLYNLVWSHYQHLKAPHFSVAAYRALLQKKFDDHNLGWIKSKRCLADLVSLARARGIRLIVIPTPVLLGGGIEENPYPFRSYIETVCDAARADGVECLDVVGLLRRPGIRLTARSGDPHPSPEVFARIADEIAPALEGPTPSASTEAARPTTRKTSAPEPEELE